VKRILKVKKLEVFGGLGQRVTQARRELAAAQVAFLSSHGDAAWFQKEKECLHVLISITTAKKNFLKHKSRNNWLNLGDGNTAFFHKVVKAQNSSNLIKVLLDAEGTRCDVPHRPGMRMCLYV
jgi:rhamnose utilization protein RhaD (predicted bifunctional aldolase and dehydrogenase)